MKSKGIFALLASLLLAAVLGGCSGTANSVGGSAQSSADAAGTKGAKPAYRRISAEEARELMDSESDYVILDVRSRAEYDEGHIPGAQLLPHDEVSGKAEELLRDKEQLILVYCRSGNRSKAAAKDLAKLGYTNVVEFGGIRDWSYEIEK